MSAALAALFLFSCSVAWEEQENWDYPLPDWVLETATPTEFSLPMFAADSIWNTPIEANPAIDPNSEIMVNQILKDLAKNSVDPVLSVDDYSVTVFFADENTPRIDVEIRNSWNMGFDVLLDVPMPENAVPDPGTDGHLAIIDESTGYVYEFWQAKQRDNGNWTASWGARIPLDSDGIYPYGMSSRASGFSVMAGVIWPEEFENGIEHALILSIPTVKKGGPVPPATETDGRHTTEGAIPEGARIQLNPELNLDNFFLTPYERAICEALQTYGAFVGDVSGSIEFETVNPLSFDGDPYNGMFTEQWIILNNIPFEELRVLELPPLIENAPLIVVEEEIYR